MIAGDTRTWIAFFQGEGGESRLLDRALEDKQVLMAPVVLTEALSDPKLPREVAHTLAQLPWIEIRSGYWERAGALRAQVLAKRRKGAPRKPYCSRDFSPYARPGLPGIR